MLTQLLGLLKTPQTTGQLALSLGTSQEVIGSMLSRLAERGYICAACETKARSATCEHCALVRLCAPAPAQEMLVPRWLLTPKGRSLV